MADYKASLISGSQYQRAREVYIRNFLSGEKGITFTEERVVVIDGESMALPLPLHAGLSADFTPANAMTSFALLDEQGDPTGQSSTYRDVYLMLMSLYYNLASLRDAATGV